MAAENSWCVVCVSIVVTGDRKEGSTVHHKFWPVGKLS